MLDVKNLPLEPKELHKIIFDLIVEIDSLKEQVKLLKKKLYGKSSEKITSKLGDVKKENSKQSESSPKAENQDSLPEDLDLKINKEALQKIMEEKKEKRKYYIESIKKFSLIRFALKINPKNEVTYFSFGIFSIISVFSIMYTIPVVVKSIYPLVIATIYHSALITSSIFITYPIWPNTFKNQAFISILWLWSLLYILVFLGYLQVILSGFSELQIMMFLLNLIVLALLCNWKVVLSLLVIGVIAAIEFFKIYLDTDS